jgi:hypothetical protein
MQKAYSFVKSGLKYTTILLALILFVGQVYHGFIKEEINNPHIAEIIEVTSTSTDLCADPNFSNQALGVFNLVLKCSLAFLAGGLISDMKFLKFGII